MRNHSFLLGLALSAFIFSGCSSTDAPEMPIEPQEPQEPAGTFVEAPKCDATVDVAVYNPAESRASSSYLEENIDRFTATRVDTKNANFTLVSYHGRNKENIGMVQLIDAKTKVVLSEIVFLDARCNFAQYRSSQNGDVVYIGVDRDGGKKPICGIVAVPVVNKKFTVGDSDQATLTPYQVTGESLNCMKQHNGDTNKIGNNILVVATGGNKGLGESDKAGFIKFEINQDDPTQLGILKEEVAANYRGYWFSFGYKNGAPAAYTYRTVDKDKGDLVYMLGAISYDHAVDMFSNDLNHNFINDYDSKAEIEVWREKGVTESFGRYSVIAIKKDPDNNKFLIVSTGSKEGGVRVYRYDQNPPVGPKLTLVDTWHKACTHIGTEIIVNGEYYIFAGCGDGVYKVRLDFNFDDKANKTLRLTPIEKRKTTTLTESGTLASTNYIQVSGSGANGKIHVAGGYEGYYVLDFNDAQFVPADPRQD